MRKGFLIVLVSLISCTGNRKGDLLIDECQYTVDSLSHDLDTSKLLLTERNGQKIFMDESNGSAGGSVFNFDSTGKLVKYFFITKGFAYSYSESFGANGNYRIKQASPIVLCNLYEKPNDSLLVEFIYSSFRKTEIQNSITLNRIPIKMSDILKCSRYSFTAFNNYKFVRQTDKSYTFISKGKYLDKCSGQYVAFSDSTTFVINDM